MHIVVLDATTMPPIGECALAAISPQPYDLAIRHPETGESSYVQVKTAFTRDEKRYGGKYVVVRGHKRNGDVYTRDEVDYFIAIYDGDVYMFPNREISEYWVKLDDIASRWTKLGRAI